MKGKFITFEGCEGVGKSRQIAYVREFLQNRGVPFILTREPGGPKISEKIREIILDAENKDMSDECEALLYAAARVLHIKQVIAPALEAGKIVLCDRYIDSSFAYQAYARGLGEKFIREINAYAMNFLPDLTLFLDLEPEAAFLRKGGADKSDRVELCGLEFHKKVYAGYLAVAREFPDRIVKIDCSGEKHQTREKILAVLKERIFDGI